MSAKLVKQNINTVFAKSFYQYIKSTDNDDSFYAGVAYIPRDDYTTYTDEGDSDSTEFFGGTVTNDYDFDDQQFYCQHMMSMHKILAGGISRVIPRIDWISGTTYSSYGTGDSFYVITKEYSAGVAKLNVYICLFSPNEASTSSPSGTSVSPIYLSDGYVWKYAYTISNSEGIRFLNSSWMPVPERITSSEADSLSTVSTRYSQYTVQTSAVAGTIYDVLVDSDYTVNTATTVSVVAVDKSSSTPTSQFSATVSVDSDGNVTKTITTAGEGYIGPIEIQDDSGTVISEISAIQSPPAGYGYDIPLELNANNVMLLARNSPTGDALKVIDENPFNMVNLIKNPLDINTKQYAENDFYIACKSILVDSNPFLTEDTFEANGITSTVISVDGNTIYYVNKGIKAEQNDYSIGDTITSTGKSAIISSVYDREIVFGSGITVMSDWKATDLTRSEDQIESFNFVIKFE